MFPLVFILQKIKRYQSLQIHILANVCSSFFSPGIIGSPKVEYSRAVVRVSAEEHGLPPVVPETVLFRPLNVAALGIRGANARLEILHGVPKRGRRWSEMMRVTG